MKNWIEWFFKNKISTVGFVFISVSVFGQNSTIREHKTYFKDTVVEYIIVSKTGEENKRKPLFIFCQGSLARPIQIISEEGSYPVLPFNEDLITEKYHLLIIGKPSIPIKETVKNLQDDYSFPKKGLPPEQYILNNNLEYYYKRNNFLIKKLINKDWIDTQKIVAAGHSEGSYIALKMAKTNRRITHLIYSGGNPLGRMMSIINQDRQNPNEKENWLGETFDDWKNIVNNKDRKEISKENTSYYHYTLSDNFTDDLLSLKIPVLVTYGTKDQNGIFNDYLHLQVIKNKKRNYTFISYFNGDHNFFPVKDHQPDYSIDNWTKVAEDWTNWLALFTK